MNRSAVSCARGLAIQILALLVAWMTRERGRLVRVDGALVGVVFEGATQVGLSWSVGSGSGGSMPS